MANGATMASQEVGHVAYSIEINGKPCLDWPFELELSQRWGQHDVFRLHVAAGVLRGYKRNLKPWPDGAAVKITWGRKNQPNGVQAWYGYVDHPEVRIGPIPGQDSTPMLHVIYTLLGTSKVLNSETYRPWKSMTPSSIARQIAVENGFRQVITETDWVLDYEVQAGESDFQFLERLAGKYGFRFWASGGTLYFINPLVLLAGASLSFVPEYRIDLHRSVVDSAANFRQLSGSNLPGSTYSNRHLYGIDATSNKLFHAEHSSAGALVDVHKQDAFARTMAEGQMRVNAAHALSQFWTGARVDVFGQPILYPGKVISLTGYGMPQGTAGRYIVSGVTHRLAVSGLPSPVTETYRTSCEIVTNSSTGLPVIKGITRVSPEFVSCTLSSGKWRSDSLSLITAGVLPIG